MTHESEAAINQITAILDDYQGSLVTYEYGETGIPDVDVPGMLARAEAAIERLAPLGSSYRRSLGRSFDQWGTARHKVLEDAMGILDALRLDYEAGHLANLPALIHGEIFSDFLDMASHLLESHYKDAAAVVAGSSLEGHLRAIAQQAGVDIEDEKGRPVKSDGLNASLAKVGAYGKSDQKQITAWLDIRNDAAHGNYAAYDQPRVALMIDGIRGFMLRTPA